MSRVALVIFLALILCSCKSNIHESDILVNEDQESNAAQGSIEESNKGQSPDLPVVLEIDPNNITPVDPTKFCGFNLLSKVLVADWAPNDTQEWAFEFMNSYGFNFARIPMEVDQLYVDKGFTVWNEKALEEIDRILERGEKYGVHILLDLHSLPGMRVVEVNGEEEVTNEERQRVWKDIFGVLSSRYQNVPAARMSFNLINEPHDIEEVEYVAMVKEVVDVIRGYSQDRMIFIDGLGWSSQPTYSLKEWNDPNIVASPHFYQPFNVTHYKAEWVEGADLFLEPEYPSPILTGYLYGSYHEPMNQPMMINGDFPKGTEVTVRISTVSSQVDFLMATEKESLLTKDFLVNDDATQWKEVNFNEEWGIYQNLWDQDVQAVLSEDAKEIQLKIKEGDWLTVTGITIQSPDWEEPLVIQPNDFTWGNPPTPIYVDASGKLDTKLTKAINQEYLNKVYFQPWEDFQNQTGIPIVACEFGVHHFTEHGVTLRVLEDDLALYQKNGWGWALWNLASSFGIMDSGRADVDYVDYKGHQLDQEMLDLLLKYKP